jgi:hypothetical protein
MRVPSLICLSLLLAACDSGSTVNYQTNARTGKHVMTVDVGKPAGAGTMRLPSGKQIVVLGIRTLAFTKDPPALMFSYRTDISIDDKVALQREVDEIWPLVRPDVERAGLTAAVISANEGTTGDGLVKHNRGFNFVFEKAPDGTWSRNN